MGQYYLIMIFIQPIRKNDIIPEAGKQIELGKTFMNYHNWETGEIDITLIYNSITNSDIQFDKKITSQIQHSYFSLIWIFTFSFIVLKTELLTEGYLICITFLMEHCSNFFMRNSGTL